MPPSSAPVLGLGGYLAGRFFSTPRLGGMMGYPIFQLEFLTTIASTAIYRGMPPGVLVTNSLTYQLAISHD